MLATLPVGPWHNKCQWADNPHWKTASLRPKTPFMKRIHSHLIGVEQGTLNLFSDFEDNGPMWVEEGQRRHETPVSFSEPFREPPSVHVGFAMWDMDSTPNQRARLAAEDVSETGFKLVFRTWGDSRVARIGANWLAIGPLKDDLDWDVE